MNQMTSVSLKRSLVLLAAVIGLVGCSDEAPLDPDGGYSPGAGLSALAAAAGEPSAGRPGVDLQGCEQLDVSAGNRLALHTYAEGVQTYRWSGAGWDFVGPRAVLYADAGRRGRIGTHFGGPTWQSNGGSRVVAAVAERCDRDPDAIAWLLLGTTDSNGRGPFGKTTFIQRVNTAGGLAPAGAGAFEGETKEVRYTAEYLFFRAR